MYASHIMLYKAVMLCLCVFSAALGGWIDKDTPLEQHRMQSPVDGSSFHLVFSDEFSVDGRSFADGHDPRWTAVHKNDYTNSALQYYNENLVTTKAGVLNISTVLHDVTFLVENDDAASRRGLRDKQSKQWSASDTNTATGPSSNRYHRSASAGGTRYKTKHYQSGMLQGWNKFCFTGGILEIRAKLPGMAHVGGLWPAMWLMGNLARATYVGSSNNVWPWSYDSCPLRAKDKVALQEEQKISACNNIQHYALLEHHGRGAPEIDILEAMAGYTPPQDRHSIFGVTTRKPFLSASFQVSPALTGPARPVPGRAPLFDPSTEAGEMQRLAKMRQTQQKEQERKQKQEEETKQEQDKEKGRSSVNERELKASQLDGQSSDNSRSQGGRGLAISDASRKYTAWYDHGLSYGVNTTLNVYFYGMRMNASPNGAAYTSDSISANTNLNTEHFDDFHTYTLEWQPRTYARRDKSNEKSSEQHQQREGEGREDSLQTSAGWLAWYLDGQFLFRIDGNALDKSGAIIPEEPMYIILNTAISSTWGFPTPCPDGCAYCQPNNVDDDSFSDTSAGDDDIYDKGRNCYDCRRSECACSMPANMCSNFPASFLVDYVRVYQTDDGNRTTNHGDLGSEEKVQTQPDLAASSSSHSSSSKPRILRYQHADFLACSTATHPSTAYINAHKSMYMRSTDSAPLKAVSVGGGACVSDSMYGSSITSTDDDYSVYEQNGGSGGFIPTVGKLRGGRGDSADTNLQHAPIGGINNYDLNRMNSSANRKGVPITLLGPELPCGGVGHGVCHMGKCVCSAGYTGPLCLAYVAQNDINYDAMAEAPLVVQTPQIMPSLALLVLVGGCALCLLTYTRTQHLRSIRAQPVPSRDGLLCGLAEQSSLYMSVSTDDPVSARAIAKTSDGRTSDKLALLDIPNCRLLPHVRPADTGNSGTSYQQQQ